MKKLLFLMLVVLGVTSSSFAQCINTIPYPMDSVTSNNSGDPQEINSCVYTGNFSTISNILPTSEYTFSITSSGEAVSKFITVTDVSNNILAQGMAPLMVNNLGYTSIRLHYNEDSTCSTLEWCLNTFITATLPCPFPTNIQVSGLTTTNAAFEWTAGGTEQSWQVVLLPNGTDAPTSATTGTTVTTPQYSVNNLTAGNPYQFYVRANCGAEFSPWRGPLNFSAICDPIAIFNENFDSTTNNQLPTCWTALKVNAAPNASIGINSLSNSTPNAIMIANDSSPANSNLFLISPKLSTVTTASHRLKFYTRGYGNVSVQVGTISSTTADATFTPLATINATTNYTEHIVDFTGYTGTDTFIAFRHPNISSSNPVFIDDVRWEAAPTCPDVQDFEATGLTPTAATLGWTAGNSVTQWDVVYATTISDPATLTPITPAPTVPEIIIPGLAADTNYYAWIRSNCSGDIGAWSNPITFRTPCLPTATIDENFETTSIGSLPSCWSSVITGSSVLNTTIRTVSSNAYSGTKSVALFNGDEATDANIILVLPNLTTVATGTHRIKFYAKSNAPANIQVGTLDSAAPGGTFTNFQALSITPTYTEYVVDFSTYVGTNNYIGIKHLSGQYVTIYVDNVRWETTPACQDVTNIQIQNIASASALVNWDASVPQSNWDVVVGTANVTNPNTLTPITPAPATNSEAVISGLIPNTNYKVWVRSTCGGTQGNGAWIGPIAFKSACLPATYINEGFETTDYGNLPDCWSSILAGPTLGQYAAVRTVNNDAAFGTNAVEMHANSSQPTDLIMLVSPYLSNLPAGTHRLKFHALSYNQDTPLQIGTLNGNTSQATYTLFQPITLGVGYNEYVVNFTTYAGTDNYIAFRNVAGNYNSTFIDNVRWEVVPTCVDVTNIQTTAVEAQTATVTWTAGATETNWQVAYGLSTVTDPNTVVPSGLLTQTTFPIAGLQDNALYNVWVRSVCAGTNGNGAWIGPITFKTRCLPTNVTYTQNFESATLPNLPDCSIIENASLGGNNWRTTYGDSGYGFDGFVLGYAGNASQASAWYFTQGINLTAGTAYTLSYKYGNNSSDNYTEKLQVLYGSSATSGSMTVELADHDQINTGTAMTHQITFTPATTGTYYFGFLAYSLASQGQLFLDNITVEAALATPETTWNSFSFYPNPVQNTLNISNQEAIETVTLYNLLGQMVHEVTVNATTATIDMSNLSTGNYIAKVKANDHIKTIKIIKE